MSQTTSLPAFSDIFAFGDSLSDAGNLSILTTATGSEPVSPPYFQENYGSSSGNIFSNGPTWVQNLSIALGLGTLKPSLLGGTDFAFGGAETGTTPQNAVDLPFLPISLPGQALALSLPAQFTQVQAAMPNPSATALYTLSIGSNDVLDILAKPGLTTQQQTTDVNDAVANEISFVKQLAAVGAMNLLVLDVPDLGKTPDVTQGMANGSSMPSAALNAEASQLASEYNTALTSQLATITGINVHVVDAFQMIDNAVADPAAFGLTNVTSAVWSGNFTSPSSGTLAVTGAAAQDQFLFWDHLHPTETGHQALADAAEQQLSGMPPLVIGDTSTGQPVTAFGQPYTGPVGDLQQQYINVTTDSLNIMATTPNWFIHSGSGEDAIAVSSGTNVLDGGIDSNFLTGGSGADTFFVDDRGPTADLWSTVDGFHAGDAATIWGITPQDFGLNWVDGQGAAGFTGLTLHATASGKPTASLTLTGFTQADMTNGRLSVSFGTDAASGSAFMFVHENS
jgi:phospholipase/lecithinase/hemolysin